MKHRHPRMLCLSFHLSRELAIGVTLRRNEGPGRSVGRVSGVKSPGEVTADKINDLAP